MRRPIGMLLAAGAMVVAVPAPVWADEEVPAATRLAARTHPAVQLLTTRVSAEVVVPYPSYRQGNLDKLLDEVARDAAAGQIPSDERSLVKTAITRMLEDVDRYLKPTGSDRVVSAESTVLCTGWWVTPDGYMVTAAHCVSPDTKVTAAAFAEQARKELQDEDEEIVKAILRDVDADDELKTKTAQLITKFNTEHLKLRDLQERTTVQLSQPGGGVDTARSLTAEVVAEGENYPGADVAVLKVAGQQNLPTLELGADSDVQVGSSLYIDGFPGTVTNEESLSPSSRLEPTFTQGPINAHRTTQKGVPYFQTQAPAYGGNSGGPVISSSGKVVGILVATLGDGEGGLAQNEHLVLPVSVVAGKLAEKNVQPVLSETSVHYNAALELFYKRHYKKALPKFRQVQNLAPGHPYVGTYISDSQAAIAAGQDKTPLPAGTKAAIGGGAAAALMLLGGLVALAVTLSRRRRRAQVVPMGWPAGPLPPPMGPPPGSLPMGQVGMPPPPQGPPVQPPMGPPQGPPVGPAEEPPRRTGPDGPPLVPPN